MESHCSLLSEKLGENIIQIVLNCDEKNGETGREIYFVAPGGFVKKHSHAANRNLDSEVYINILDIMQYGVKNLKILPEVAGNNSPTKRLEHSIEKSTRPQVYLVIKKAQFNVKAWDQLNQDFSNYLKTLHFACVLEKNILSLVSTVDPKKQEFVDIDLAKYSVNYLCNNMNDVQNIIDETVSLGNLKKLQQDLGVEK